MARAFGARGANVAVLARGEEGPEGAAKDVEAAGGTSLAIPVDVADAAAVEAAASQVVSRFGALDVWVNNAFSSVFGRPGRSRRRVHHRRGGRGPYAASTVTYTSSSPILCIISPCERTSTSTTS